MLSTQREAEKKKDSRKNLMDLLNGLNRAELIELVFITFGTIEEYKVLSSEKEISFTLSDIVKEIKKIIDMEQFFTIDFFSNQICFNIYEEKVVISYTSNNNILCFECDLTKGRLLAEQINELNQIMNLLEANKPLLKSFCSEKNK